MLALLLGGLLLVGQPDAPDPPAQASLSSFSSSSFSRVMPSLRLPTMGGIQFWADLRWHAGYRVQRNTLLKTCRLLDDRSQLVVLGTREECLARMEAEVGNRPACPPDAEIVVLLHGLLGFRQAMSGLGDYLHDEGGYTIVNLSYPSTQGEVAEHAACLAEVIDHLRASGARRIHFVAHSLGNLVVRRYFFALAEQRDEPNDGTGFGRMVMLGPPNLGSQFAKTRGIDLAAQLVGGVAGSQLASKWKDLEPELATPPLEFGIVAGGLGNSVGLNPLLPGDDDGVVAVDETRLPGAADFILVPANHSALMLSSQARDYTLRFLREGRFRENGPSEGIGLSP